MEATLQASRRERFGRNEAVRLRQEGKIPAVLYGGKDGAQALAVDPKALSRILHSESGVNTLIALKMGETKDTRVLVKEYQVDPVSRKLLHADFYRIAMDQVLKVTVPIRLTGEPKGVKAEAGVGDVVQRDRVVECLPPDMPEHIRIDTSELALHDGVRVNDLQRGGQWKPVSELDPAIAHV